MARRKKTRATPSTTDQAALDAQAKVATAATLHLYRREPVADKVQRGADNRPISRGNVVRSPQHYSESLRCNVPTSVGRVLDIFRQSGARRPEMVVVEVALAGGSGRGYFDASKVRRSQAKAAE